MKVTALVELGCVCAAVDAAISSTHTPKKDRALMIFICRLLKDQTLSIDEQQVLRSINAATQGWGRQAGERARDLASGNATSLVPQVKNELHRQNGEFQAQAANSQICYVVENPRVSR